MRKMLLHILKVRFPLARFLFSVPVLKLSGISNVPRWHFVIVAGLKGPPDGFIAYEMEHFGNILQIFLAVFIRGKRFSSSLNPPIFPMEIIKKSFTAISRVTSHGS